MRTVFMMLMDMSVSSCPLILAVILLRMLLRRSPKNISLVLWAIVGLRLICPLSVESVLSLSLPTNAVSDTLVSYQSIDGIQGDSLQHTPSRSFPAQETTSAPPQTGNHKEAEGVAETRTVDSTHTITVLLLIWLIGCTAMTGYGIFNYISLRKRTSVRIRLHDEVYACDGIDSAFVLGLIHPKIIVPSETDHANLYYIEAHERAHIARLDHIWKPVGFMLLALYWFHPLVWISYILFCRDIEYACDERIIKPMSIAERQGYSRTLLACSLPHKNMAIVPVAFGEIGIKERVCAIMNYKKPKLWVISVAVIACVMVAVCFFTSPVTAKNAIDNSKTAVQEQIAKKDNCPYTMVFAQAPHDDLIWLGLGSTADWGYYDRDGILVDYYYRDGRSKNQAFVSQLYSLLDPEQYEYVGEGSYDIIGTDGNYPEDLCVRFADENSEYLHWFYLDGDGDLLYVVASRSGEEYEAELEEYLDYREQGLPTHEPEPVFGKPRQYKAPAELYDTVRDIVLSLPETRKYVANKMVNGVNSYIDDTGAMFCEYEIESPAIAQIVIHSDLHLISKDYGCDYIISRNSYEKFYNIIWPAFCDLDCIETMPPQYNAEKNDTHTIYLYASDYYDTSERDNHVIALLGDSGIVKVTFNGETYWYDGGKQMMDYCQQLVG